MVKTPLEDFTTEILAGILTQNKKIGDAFVNRVLKIEGDNFSFSTQEHFDSINPEHPNCRVDIVIRSENMICFVESKVESREGYIQLERYSNVLDSYRIHSTTYLKYCTKYFDLKEIDEHGFHQFRWADVYRFLLQWNTSDIIKDFLDFLHEHDMSDNMDFTISDLVTLQGLSPVIKKMDRYLEKVRPIFAKQFEQGRIKDSGNFKQIKSNSRFIFHAENIIGESGYSEIGVGFDFTITPVLVVWIWLDDNNSKISEFKSALTKTNIPNNGESWLGFNAPISDFISSVQIEHDIENWFFEAFQKVREFITSNPNLKWNI